MKNYTYKETKIKNELSNTIQKELENNNLYLNFCSSKIQILRSYSYSYDLGLVLNSKSLDSLKSILNELLAKKEKHALKISQDFEILTEQENQKTELNTDFEKANLQIIDNFQSSFNIRNEKDNTPLF